MNIRKHGLLWLLLAALLALGSPAARADAEAIPIYFFHDTICASCDGTEAFLAIFAEALPDAQALHPYTLELHNTFHVTGSAVYRQVLAQHGLADAMLEPPMVIIGGKALAGMENIAANLREYFLTAAETESLPEDMRLLLDAPKDALFAGFEANPQDTTLLYFYRITCDECSQTAPVLEALPGAVEIDGQPSTVRLLTFNTRAGANRERVRALFARYDVPAEKQQVPIVFLTDTYLSGYEEIAAGLPAALEAGQGLGFQFPPPGAP